MKNRSLQEPILEARKVSKNFDGVEAVCDLDVVLERGEMLGLIGPNGSGKTTFFNVITGIVPRTGGEILFKGEPIADLPPYRVASRGIARTFQNTRVFPNLSVLENVLVGAHLSMKSDLLSVIFGAGSWRQMEKAAHVKAVELLEFVNLSRKKDELGKNLAYGEQKRLEIARALAGDPELVLLDEPAAGVNPQEAQELMDLIKAIQRSGKTVFIIEHNMKVIMGICERIVAIANGRKIAEGPPKVIQKDERVREAYLGEEG